MNEIKIKIKGMTCRSCENLIKRELEKLESAQAQVDFEKEIAHVKFDETKTNLKEIVNAIENKDYECTEATAIGPFNESLPKAAEAETTQETAAETEPTQASLETKQEAAEKIELPLSKKDKTKTGFNYKYITISLGILIALIGAYFILKNTTGLNLPELGPGTSLALIFLIGILTGFHCIAMCGGFVVSYTAKEAEKTNKVSVKSHLAYGAGKTITYTALGAVFGLIGSIFTFTPMLRGIAAILAGIFLMLFGLSMLNVFKWARKIQIKGPSFLARLPEKVKTKNPFVIGLLNGLMIACGPLQAMYVFAAATGSITQGALTMLAFGLGTLPVMIGFGMIASLVSSQLTKKILKASAIVVIILGVVMLNRGLALAGQPNLSTVITTAPDDTEKVNVKDGYQEINMDVTTNGYEPNKFILKKGVPVKWNINVKQLTGCNNEILVPKYNLKIKLKEGLNTAEFTPTEEGTVSWSCWMGMLRGAFIVKGDVGTQEDVQKELAKTSVPKGGTCGMGSGGGCGCGAR